MNFDNFFEEKCKKSNYYLGVNLAESEFSKYWIDFNLEKKKITKKEYFRNIRRIFSGFLFKFVIKSRIIFNKDIDLYKNKLYFILLRLNESNESNNIDKILEKLIQEYNKKEIVLVVFDLKKYEEYVALGYSVCFIKTSKYFFTFRSFKFNDINFIDILRRSRLISVIELVDTLIRDMKPKLILTTQDYSYEDNIFTQLGKKYKITTITHLHGIVPKNIGPYKYFYSDYIMVWGDRDIKLLQEYFSLKRLKVIGNSKFKPLLENRKKSKKGIVLCMTDISKEKNLEKKILETFLKLETKEEKIIKLHPRMNQEKFKNKYIELLKNVKIEKDYKYIEKAKYMLCYRTTAIIDGLCCGASVIELYNDTLDKNIDLLENLDESIVSLNDLDKEIKKRENTEQYFNEIIKKQDKALKKIIFSFESEKIEKEYINEILKKREEELC